MEHLGRTQDRCEIHVGEERARVRRRLTPDGWIVDVYRRSAVESVWRLDSERVFPDPQAALEAWGDTVAEAALELRDGHVSRTPAGVVDATLTGLS